MYGAQLRTVVFRSTHHHDAKPTRGRLRDMPTTHPHSSSKAWLVSQQRASRHLRHSTCNAAIYLAGWGWGDYGGGWPLASKGLGLEKAPGLTVHLGGRALTTPPLSSPWDALLTHLPAHQGGLFRKTWLDQGRLAVENPSEPAYRLVCLE